MNNAIELHDSEISAVCLSDCELRVVFDPAYVHCSAGRPGVDPGLGYLQSAELVFTNAQLAQNGGDCTGTISGGFVANDLVEYANVIPLPLTLSGRISAEIIFNTGAVMKVTGSGLSCLLKGDARYLEAYEG